MRITATAATPHPAAPNPHPKAFLFPSTNCPAVGVSNITALTSALVSDMITLSKKKRVFYSYDICVCINTVYCIFLNDVATSINVNDNFYVTCYLRNLLVIFSKAISLCPSSECLLLETV